MADYNFIQSTERITQISKKVPEHIDGPIPSTQEIDTERTILVNATVIYIYFDILNKNNYEYNNENKMQTLLAFLSESIKISKANKCFKDAITFENKLMIIYNTTFKTDLNEVINDVAKIRSLSMVTNKISRIYSRPELTIKVGVAYGPLAMLTTDIEEINAPHFLWRGKTISEARLNSEQSIDEVIISKIVWQNLNENNQKLFHRIDSDDKYGCNIINVTMDNWINK